MLLEGHDSNAQIRVCFSTYYNNIRNVLGIWGTDREGLLLGITILDKWSRLRSAAVSGSVGKALDSALKGCWF